MSGLWFNIASVSIQKLWNTSSSDRVEPIVAKGAYSCYVHQRNLVSVEASSSSFRWSLPMLCRYLFLSKGYTGLFISSDTPMNLLLLSLSHVCGSPKMLAEP